ncbi:phosphotransferase family protein [Bauldia sp.]|uniref:phosphotransferase family protein n=1 Tax=Bauldia sp. TaxID=2575872 RepID=UPI003BA8DC05
MTTLPPDILSSLARMGLTEPGASVDAERLTGGVSSDIWKVTAGSRVFCVKRAMAKLAVEDDWFAPVERNRFERNWYAIASERVPGVAPAVLGYDDDLLFFAMAWLDPDHYSLWKPDLMKGRVDRDFAATVGEKLAEVHAATAGDRAIAAAFPTGRLFEALRLEPYLRATGQRHPDLSDALGSLADRTAATETALVHGDVSPKNIMKGPKSVPVFLDAECAWYGDPAFDLAFCLNHLLLKCIAAPQASRDLIAAFGAMHESYMAGVNWEPREDLEARAASLLPALLLARVDGKSPVEYITDDDQRAVVRRVAVPLIKEPPASLADISNAWSKELGI